MDNWSAIVIALIATIPVFLTTLWNTWHQRKMENDKYKREVENAERNRNWLVEDRRNQELAKLYKDKIKEINRILQEWTLQDEVMRDATKKRSRTEINQAIENKSASNTQANFILGAVSILGNEELTKNVAGLLLFRDDLYGVLSEIFLPENYEEKVRAIADYFRQIDFLTLEITKLLEAILVKNVSTLS
jgi:hypothetical protein